MPSGALIVLMTTCLFAAPHAPLFWSPDGDWLAYTSAVRPISSVMRPGWFFDAAPRPLGDPAHDVQTESGPTSYRIWASKADGSLSFKIEDSPLPLTAPTWSPDGSSLVFGRVIAQSAGRYRFEVVLQDSPEHRRVLSSEAWSPTKEELERLTGMASTWSPDGRFLAVPSMDPKGIAILRADTGRSLKVLEGAFLPSWSPDSSRLAYVKAGERETLYCLDSNLGAPRMLMEVGPIGQQPLWSEDSQYLLVVRGKPRQKAGRPDSETAELARIRADSGQVDRVRPLVSHAFGIDQPLAEVAVAIDFASENLFYTASAEGQGTLLVWARTRDNSIQKRFYPLGIPLSVGPLALSASGERLALRLGPPELLSPPAWLDPQDEVLTPIAADDASRALWLQILVTSARKAIDEHEATSRAAGMSAPGAVRPTLLPTSAQLNGNSELGVRLRRIGRIGRPICDRPVDAPAPTPELEELLTESRAFFDYLRGDYAATLESIKQLEARTESADQRLRLLGLRAQVRLAQGDVEHAEPTIEYIRSNHPARSTRVERTLSGLVLTVEPEASRAWPDHLAAELDRVRQGRDAGEAEAINLHNPFGNRNPDAPAPGLGLDPERGLIFPLPRVDLPEMPFQVEFPPFREVRPR